MKGMTMGKICRQSKSFRRVILMGLSVMFFGACFIFRYAIGRDGVASALIWMGTAMWFLAVDAKKKLLTMSTVGAAATISTIVQFVVGSEHWHYGVFDIQLVWAVTMLIVTVRSLSWGTDDPGSRSTLKVTKSRLRWWRRKPIEASDPPA